MSRLVEQVRPEHQGGEEVRRVDGPGGLGRARGGHRRASGAPEPGADAPPPRHPGVRACPRRGQGDPDPSARLPCLQRRLRRRPDGRPPAALRGGAGGGARILMLSSNNIPAGARKAFVDAVAGHGARRLLPDVLRARPQRGHGRGARPQAAPVRLRGGGHPRLDAGQVALQDPIEYRRNGERASAHDARGGSSSARRSLGRLR